MKPLFTEEQFNYAKTNDSLPYKCYCCGKTYFRTKHSIQRVSKNVKYKAIKYCSKECQSLFKTTKIITNCIHCNKKVHRILSQHKKSKSGNVFCSKSCAATYNNIHKKHGTRKSKLEKWLETKLIELYPDLEIHFNRKDTINSELDIYIPSMKLGFELNGLFHYEPIFGQDKLSKIQNNDNRKFQACLERNIELCIIDSSQQKYFKEQTSMKYLDVITNVILRNKNESQREELNPQSSHYK
jgi:hypothetical protein